jgi:hypothetical protein
LSLAAIVSPRQFFADHHVSHVATIQHQASQNASMAIAPILLIKFHAVGLLQ